MQKRRLALLFTMLLIGTLVITACGPRPEQGKLGETSTNEQLVVDLPAIYIDYDDQGNASISGTAISQLGALLGSDLSALNRTPEQIQKLKDAGVQHILANITPAGLNVYANGQSLLSVAWTPETLANMGDVLGNLDDPTAKQVKDLVPLLSNMSVGIVMNFPTADGAEKLPLVADAPDPKALMADAKAAAPAALTALLPDNLKNMSALLGGLLAGLPPLKVTFDAAGAGKLEGLAPFILSQIPAGAIALPADQLESIKGLGIQSLTIKNSADGLNLSVNGKAMPTILWNRGEFANLATLGIEAGVLKTLANLDDGTLDTLQQVADAAPILQTAKLDVTVNLPQ